MEGVAGVSTGVDVCMLGLPQADQAFVGEQDAEMVLGVIRAQDSTQELWRKHGAGAQGDCHGLVAVEHGTTGVHVVVKGVASNVDMLVGGDQDGGVVSTQCETLLAKTHGQLDTWMLVPRALCGRGGGWIGRAKSRGAHAQPCPTPPADAENKG